MAEDLSILWSRLSSKYNGVSLRPAGTRLYRVKLGKLILINCLTEAIFGMVVACADTIVNLILTGFGITLQDCLRQGK